MKPPLSRGQRKRKEKTRERIENVEDRIMSEKKRACSEKIRQITASRPHLAVAMVDRIKGAATDSNSLDDRVGESPPAL